MNAANTNTLGVVADETADSRQAEQAPAKSPFDDARLIGGTRAARDLGSLRGHVDFCDGVNGVSGWALDIAEPERKLALQLLVDDAVIALCETDLVRRDIALLMQSEIVAGFKFPDTALDALRSLTRSYGQSKVRVRVAGTDLVIPSHNPMLPLGEAFADVPTARRVPVGFDLPARLSHHLGRAAELAKLPLRPSVDQVIGYVEAVAIGAGGEIWLQGWLRPRPYVDCAVVLVDQRKVAGGMAFTLYDRDDLGTDASAFIGLLYSEWRPSAASDLYVYLDDPSRSQLKGIKSFQLLKQHEFRNRFELLKDRCHTGHTAALWRLATNVESWSATAQNTGVSVEAALDQIIVLPYFGCLAVGWALSAMKSVQSFALKLGDAVLECDPESLLFKSRPDLATVLPGCEKLTEKAGFVAVFRGVFSVENLSKPMLKVILSDGSTVDHHIDQRALRRLRHAVAIETVLQLLPSIQLEAFFPDFAAALRRDARATAGSCRPFAVKPATRAVVFVVPDDRSELFLLFEQFNRVPAAGINGLGLIFIAQSSDLRSDVLALFNALAASVGQACSLFFVDDATYAIHSLPEILEATRVRHFLFAAPHVYFTELGWRTASAVLAEDALGLSFFKISDPAASPDAEAIVSARCFAWTAIAFAAWHERAPSFIGGYHELNGLEDPAGPPKRYPGMAYFSKMPSASPLAVAINAVVM
jgi:hypothetical protein